MPHDRAPSFREVMTGPIAGRPQPVKLSDAYPPGDTGTHWCPRRDDSLESWLLCEGAIRVKRADGHKHFSLRGHHVVVLGHGPQMLSATSLSLVMKQLEQAGYSREQLRREWGGRGS